MAQSRQQVLRRVAASAVVVALHFLVALLLTRQNARRTVYPIVDAPAITWLTLPDPIRDEAQGARQAPISRDGRGKSESADSAISAPTGVNSDHAPVVDWADAAERAATRAASEDAGRSITDVPPPRVKPFAWDKTHTERVSFPLSGGMAIRLNDHCEIVLLPLPLGGCVIGKIEPRGDLFDGMNSPSEFGDWKD
jgi:hypothetical protein